MELYVVKEIISNYENYKVNIYDDGRKFQEVKTKEDYVLFG